MAEKKASLVVELRDLATNGLGVLKDKMGGLQQSAVSLGADMAALGLEVYKAVTSFAEQEAATARLTLALRNTSSDASGASSRLAALGESLSKTTGFTDDTITSFQAMLATMGFNEAAIAQMTPRVLDMSRAFGVDAGQAAMLLGKSIETGSTASLRRMGLVVDESAFKIGDFGRIMAEVDGKVKGAAETYGNTTAGAIAKLKVSFDQLQQAVGEVLAGALQPVFEILEKGFETLQKLLPALTIFIAGFQEIGNIVGATVGSLGSLSAVMVLVFQRDWAGAAAAAKKGMADWTAQIEDGSKKASDKILAAWQQLKTNMSSPGAQPGVKHPNHGGGGGAPNLGAGTALDSDEFAIKLAQMKGYQAQAEMLTKQHEMRMLAAHGSALQAQQLMDAYYQRALLDGMAGMFGNLSALSRSKHKELAAIGRVAATGQAIVQTYLGANEAYAALAGIPVVGPALGRAAQAAAIVAGMANVAQINGVSFAEGGMAMPVNGGIPGVFAEAGKPEAVIPLDDPRTTRKLQRALGGGGVHIHMHNSQIIANDAGLEDFVRRVDKVYWRLKRNRQTVAI